MSSATPARGFDETEDLFYRAPSSASADVASSTATTATWLRRTSRMGQAALPLAVAAAFAAATPPSLTRRRWSAGRASSSNVREVGWQASDFVYTQAIISQREIDGLNRLFALNAADGFSLDLSDD